MLGGDYTVYLRAVCQLRINGLAPGLVRLGALGTGQVADVDRVIQEVGCPRGVSGCIGEEFLHHCSFLKKVERSNGPNGPNPQSRNFKGITSIAGPQNLSTPLELTAISWPTCPPLPDRLYGQSGDGRRASNGAGHLSATFLI